MEHFYFFYFAITFSIGIVSLGILVTIYVKTRETLLQYYLYFYAAFSLLVVLNAFLSYIRTNVPTINPDALFSLNYFESLIAKYLLMFAIPVFAHCLFSVPHPKLKNVIFAVLSIMTYLVRHVLEFVMHDDKLTRLGNYIEDIVVISVIIYTFIIGIYYYKKLQENIRKNLARKFLILHGSFLPGIFNDTFLSEFSPLRFYPILYCCFSIIFTYHFIKKLFNQSQVSTATMPEEEVLKKYHISSREQEVIALILQGYSNNKIAETLFISLNTVKKHIRNIYPKLGVNSRYELITFFKNTAHTDSTRPEQQ